MMTTPAAVTTTQVDQLPGYRPTATTKVTASLQQGEFQDCHVGRVCVTIYQESLLVCHCKSLCTDVVFVTLLRTSLVFS